MCDGILFLIMKVVVEGRFCLFVFCLVLRGVMSCGDIQVQMVKEKLPFSISFQAQTGT
jgi:hypothetical protein